MTIKHLLILALLLSISSSAFDQRFNQKSVYDDLRRIGRAQGPDAPQEQRSRTSVTCSNGKT